MSGTEVPPLLKAELARRALAPIIALAASSLAALCTVTLVDVLQQLPQLSSMNERFVGWFAVGGLLSVVVALAAVSLVRHVGSGPPLSLGAAVSVFGLALGGPAMSDSAKLPIALPLLGLAVGALLGGGLAATMELPREWSRLTLVGWALPLFVAWPAQVWYALHQAPDGGLRLVSIPSMWVVAAIVALVVSWGVASMLIDPGVVSCRAPGWQAAWSALIVVQSVGFSLIMTLGFHPDITRAWLRPLVLVSGGLLGAGWALVTVAIPGTQAKLAYVVTSVLAWTLPTLLTFLVLVADDGDSRVSRLQIAALATVTILGASAGAWSPLRAAPAGLLVVAAACAGAWVLPDQPWLMLAAGLPLVAGGGAVWAAGLSLATDNPATVRFVGFANVGALMLGLLIALPLGWALVGDLPVSTGATRATGRAYLGLGLAVSLLAAAYAAIMVGRIWSDPAGASHSAGRPRR